MNQEQVEQAPVVIGACADSEGWEEALEEVTASMTNHESRESVRTCPRRPGSQPNTGMWVTKQTMIAATTMMWMAEALGCDTGPTEGFYEDQVRKVLGIPVHVRVIFLLAVGHLQGEDGSYSGRLPACRTVFSERYGEPLNLFVNS